MVSTLPGPHDYRSAGIAPALDHVGAGVLEECQPIRVEYRGLDHLLVGTPHWITGPSGSCHRPACQRDLPLARGEIYHEYVGERSLASGEFRLAALFVVCGWGERPKPPTLPSHKGRCWPFIFFPFRFRLFRPLPFFTKRQNRAPALYRLSGSKTPWVRGPANSPRCFGSNMPWENGPAKTTTPTIDFAS